MSIAPLFSEDLQQISEAAFVKLFGPLYEDSPWIAQQTWRVKLADMQPTSSSLLAALADTVDTADEADILALVRAHPDLAGKTAMQGQLTAESTEEQASARLDQCSSNEYERFQQLNDAYWKKFDFPFIMAVRGRNRQEILAEFEKRLLNTRDEELPEAVRQIHTIAQLRLDALLAAQQA